MTAGGCDVPSGCPELRVEWSGVESDQDRVRSKSGITSGPKAYNTMLSLIRWS